MNDYITSGVTTEIPIVLQKVMFSLVEQLKIERDYLQVFNLECTEGQVVIRHSQECPEYEAIHKFNSEGMDFDKDIKVYIIIEEKHRTMMLASEY